MNNETITIIEKEAQRSSEESEPIMPQTVELKVAKTDEFGNEYFVKETVSVEDLQAIIDMNNRQIADFENENVRLQARLDLINNK